ncbi:hypothetical protein [Streptomyces buecherae]|uniref:C2H2-type domain-containing protein n=1 Tax=Streptomyces buecherae TaxID=2763006 RepID=A0A7H8NBU8_9ACTN|nr:hypothetical protein [Streptomyces buecherae]QKW51979.1 hypothetical protein HUT08_23350 [Streptomyces buecherae]
MSENTGTTGGSNSIPEALARAQAEPSGTEAGTAAGAPAAREAYAFACLHCGHGWEQAYDIEHHVDALGQAYVSYHAGGERVPSPLTQPTCLNCGAHVLRIMRSGQVTSASRAMSFGRAQRRRTAEAGKTGTRASAPATSPAGAADAHHWHLADLWPFHRK